MKGVKKSPGHRSDFEIHDIRKKEHPAAPTIGAISGQSFSQTTDKSIKRYLSLTTKLFRCSIILFEDVYATSLGFFHGLRV
jgi:hypothetical protein